MEPIVHARLVCRRCGRELDVAAAACPRCGSTIGGSAVPVQSAADASLQRLLDRPGVVLLLLFGVTAAMGIPFLWRSRAFSTAGKVVLTVIVSLYTLLILWLFWLVFSWSLGSIRDSLSL